jgi:hypothetical protein
MNTIAKTPEETTQPGRRPIPMPGGHSADFDEQTKTLRMQMPAGLTNTDWENAFYLLQYLNHCLGAALYIPGIGAALQHSEQGGIHHVDPSFRFIDDLMFGLKQVCAVEGRFDHNHWMKERHRQDSQLGNGKARVKQS